MLVVLGLLAFVIEFAFMVGVYLLASGVVGGGVGGTVAGVLAVVSPEYISQFVTSGVIGYAMIAVALLMFAIGGFWMSRIVKIKF